MTTARLLARSTSLRSLSSSAEASRRRSIEASIASSENLSPSGRKHVQSSEQVLDDVAAVLDQQHAPVDPRHEDQREDLHDPRLVADE